MPEEFIPQEAEYISYIEVFVFGAGALFVVFMALFLSWLVRPKIAGKAKEIAYECGEEPVGNAWFRFNIRFYIVALVFIIFDVEIALVFPIATIFKDFTEFVADTEISGLALFLFVEMFLFVLILFAGLVYIWVKGDLSWVRPELLRHRRQIQQMRAEAHARAEEITTPGD